MLNSLSRSPLHAGLLAVALAATPPTLTAQATTFRLTPAKIDAVFKDFGPTTPGCALGLYDRGKVIYSKGYGMADLTWGIPITASTVFDIGSTSKQFAAASIILLANEGKLQLSDDVRKYIPELPTYGSTITIDHMLRHTSGLRDYNGLLYLGGHNFEDFTDDDDALKVIVAQRNLNFAPGSKWDYSNTGFFLLSVIVKRVTGKTLAEFAKERIFTPLGMPVTNFRVDHTALLPKRATAYEPAGKGGFSIDMSDWDQAGDGAVNTTVLELAKWDANFYDPKVGGKALIEKLQQLGTLNNRDSLEYARGLFVDKYRGLRRVHHGGAWAGYRAMLMRFPEQGLGIGLTCNRGDADTQGRSERVADVVLAGAFKEPAVAKGAPKASDSGADKRPAAAVDAAAFAGTYFAEDVQSVLSIANADGKAILSLFGGKIPLESAGDDRLTAMGGMVQLDFAKGHATVKMVIRGGPGTDYRRVDKITPTASDLAEIAGSYHSPELGTTWTIRVDGAKAFVAGRAVGDSELEAIVKDGFQARSGFIAFTRNASGKIDGFNVSASRMQRIRFDR